MLLHGPKGDFEFIPRDLSKWPRNGVPPAVEPGLLRGFTVHYPGGPIGGDYRGVPLEVGDERLVARAIRNHNAKPGMTDVGYCLFVGRSGLVWEGRGVRARNGANGPILRSIVDEYPPGTTTTNRYWVSVFVCCGTDDGWQAMTAAQEAALIRLCAWTAKSHGITRPRVNGHRDVRATACPGDAVWNRLVEIEAAINAPTDPPPPAPPAITEEDSVHTLPVAQRMYDTRRGGVPLTAGEVRDVPGFLANEVVVNITVVNPDSDGHLVVWGGGGKPGTSNVNFTAGQTTSNLTRTRTDNGVLHIEATSGCHLVVDLQAAG